jgi:hypothetical protein
MDFHTHKYPAVKTVRKLKKNGKIAKPHAGRCKGPWGKMMALLVIILSGKM